MNDQIDTTATPKAPAPLSHEKHPKPNVAFETGKLTRITARARQLLYLLLLDEPKKVTEGQIIERALETLSGNANQPVQFQLPNPEDVLATSARIAAFEETLRTECRKIYTACLYDEVDQAAASQAIQAIHEQIKFFRQLRRDIRAVFCWQSNLTAEQHADVKNGVSTFNTYAESRKKEILRLEATGGSKSQEELKSVRESLQNLIKLRDGLAVILPLMQPKGGTND